MRTRPDNQPREITFKPNPMPYAYSSVAVHYGNTIVYCSVSLSDTVPPYALADNKGWLSAEYAMLPCSTAFRKKRDVLKQDGRGVEISRLIGRALRASIDLYKIPGYALTVDCDVIAADGGTRTAAISGGYAALRLAVMRMIAEGRIQESPLLFDIASISVGKVNGKILVDLDYSEDSTADADFNIVMNSLGEFIEIQGSSERATVRRQELDTILSLAESAILYIITLQDELVHSVSG